MGLTETVPPALAFTQAVVGTVVSLLAAEIAVLSVAVVPVKAPVTPSVPLIARLPGPANVPPVSGR